VLDAYLYAEQAQNKDGTYPAQPSNLSDLHLIDRFGATAMGYDVLPFGKIRHMIITENIVNAYETRKRSENWDKWAQANPDMLQVLTKIEIMLNATD